MFQTNHFISFSWLLLLAMLTCLEVNAQDALKNGLGKAKRAWLEMDYYTKDSSAEAVVLDERVIYKLNRAGHLSWTVRRTIKILTNNGYSYADHSLPVIKKNLQVKEIEGYTYNLTDNGTIKTSMLEASSIMEETNNKGKLVGKTFTMPNVRKGSVIDIYYKLYIKKAENLPPMVFQEDIPVAKSELYVEYPRDYIFENETRSFYPFKVSDMGMNIKDNITFMRFKIEDLPAFKAEKYITAPQDYLTRVDFALRQSPEYRYSISWNSIGRFFVNISTVKNILEKNINTNQVIADSVMVAHEYNKLPAAKALHKLLIEKVTANSIGFIPNAKSVQALLNEGKGSVADVNMAYITLARLAGIDANPILISTRANGRVTKIEKPNPGLFNYLAIKVVIDDKTYLTSAADPFQPFGTLPAYCLNGEGMVINIPSGGATSWIDLTNIGSSTELVNIQVNIDPATQEALVKYHQEYSGYEAAGIRRKLQSEGKENIENGFKEQFDGWEVASVEVTGQEDLEESVALDIEMVNYNLGDADAQTLYIPVNIDQRWQENPLKKQERQYDVDMNYPWTETYMMTIQVPEGYKVESLPESFVYRLPDQSAQFTFGTNNLGQTVKITSQIKFKKAVYKVQEYSAIREIMTNITGRFNEMIVLKKE